MDISNYNSQAMPNVSTPQEKAAPIKNEEQSGCLNFDTAWCTEAANAVGEAFNNMDDFLVMYKESQS